MRRRPRGIVESWRVRSGFFASKRGDLNGCFVRDDGLKIISSNGSGWDLPPPVWEHVSVSFPDRCPTWDEMASDKHWFWDSEEIVLQIHPPQSQYVNQHPHCLHLWKPIGLNLPLPPTITIGTQV